MRPITQVIPKALIPVHGRPFVDYQLTWLASQGVTDVVFCVGYKSSQVRDHVGDGSRWNLHVVYADEGQELKGTAGALRVALDSTELRERFFVLYGDSYLSVQLTQVAAAFTGSGLPALMTVFRNEGRWETSNVIYRDEKIELYDKRNTHPRAAEMRFVDYGLTMFQRDYIADRVRPGQTLDMAEVLNQLSLEGRLAGFQVTERFYEVGSAAGLADFERYALTALPEFMVTQ
jgi:NDP-sugar pyrophosphorylase family protein